MMTHPDLILDDRPSLREPTLILAWAGWNDAGDAATTAARYLVASLDADPFGHIDAEPYYDFTEARPMARYRDGGRDIVWPTTDFYAVRRPKAETDLIIGVGIEPHFRWRHYMTALEALIRTMKVTFVVSFGAVAAGVPHTQPVRVNGSANSDALAQRFGMQPSRYEGPTGIVGVFHDFCRRRGIEGVSLWAPVPHYLPGVTNPVGARALLEKLDGMLGFNLALGDLDPEITRFRRRIEQAMRQNDELRSYVQRLEAARDEEGENDGGFGAEAPPPGEGAELPSADSIIQDLEAFLRERQEPDA